MAVVIPTLSKSMPDFKLASTSGEIVSLKDFRGSLVVLYFYPRDKTPGCTQEGLDFKEHIAKFRRRNTVVLGVSRDSLASHQKFKEKYQFPFDLLADEDAELCIQYGILKDKNMYGKKVKGIERTTYLIDETGTLRQIWSKVKVPGHVEAILAEIKEMQAHA